MTGERLSKARLPADKGGFGEPSPVEILAYLAGDEAGAGRTLAEIAVACSTRAAGAEWVELMLRGYAGQGWVTETAGETALWRITDRGRAVARRRPEDLVR